MKFGARVLKTGLAVSIAMYAALLFDFTAAVFAGIAAVFSIQPSIYRSYQKVLQQIEANLLGAVIAIVMVSMLGNDPVIIGFTIILVMAICIGFGMKQEIVMLAVVTVIAIMETTDMPFVEFAVTRVSSVFIGIFSALLVNLVFLPPKYETRLFKQIEQTSNEILQWIRLSSRHLSDQPALKEEIEKLIEDITKLDHTYLLFSEERTYSRKRRYTKARKQVLFRQLIHTAKKSLEVLRTLQRYDQTLGHLSHDLKTRIVKQIDEVVHIHEKLIMMCMGKIREDDEQVVHPDEGEDITALLEDIIAFTQNKSDAWQFLPLAGKLMDYENQLEHLKKLLGSYQQYHKQESIKTESNEL
ncbi:aromatic acid exporter family protein [Salinibacillus aidingensis]|uniref:Aromatic acid exporter family protein n=1 Tax=Salinibacillus aidingensis TaxID=237684 RepID=A0ABN1BIR7_9BACI